MPEEGREGPRVVAAFDLSPVGRRVVERARLIAEQQDSQLLLVHVLETVKGAFLDADHLRSLRRYRQAAAEQTLRWVRERTSVPAELALPQGNPARAIARLVGPEDLVVAGASSLDIERTGSVTRRLAHTARAGVLSVRRQPRAPYRRVLAAVDMSEASRQAVELALRMAPKAEVTAVYALPARFDELLADAGVPAEELAVLRARRLRDAATALEEFVAGWEGVVKSGVVDGPPLETIAEEVRRRAGDLVTVASRGMNADSMVLLGTVAEGIMETAPCDVALARVPSVFRRP